MAFNTLQRNKSNTQLLLWIHKKKKIKMSMARVTMVDYLLKEVGDVFKAQVNEVLPKNIHQD